MADKKDPKDPKKPKTFKEVLDERLPKAPPVPKYSSFEEALEKGRPTERVLPPSTPTGYGPLDDISSGLMNFENYFQRRAEEQGTGEQLAKAVANLPVNFGAGLLESAGYLGELANYGMKELTDQEYKADFSNALTEFAQGARNPFGEVYREDPNSVFDFDDPAFWINNGAGLVESIAEFAVTGAGVGKLLGKGAQGISKAINNSMKASRLTRGINTGLNVGAQGVTSGTLGYLEGAMTGAQVYENALNQGKSVEEASEAAATTVKWNTALIGALNVSSVYPLFKSRNLLKRGEKFGLTRGAGETTEEFAERMAKAQTNPSRATKGFYERFGIAMESAQESVEEVTNLWAEVKGEQKAGIADTDAEGMELFTELFKSEEGILSAVLGALGGAGQTVAMNRIPFNRRAVTTEDGEQELRWLSAKQMQDMQDEGVGMQYAKALEKDARDMMSAQEKLQKAIDNNNEYEIRQAQFELFNISSKRSIPIDGGESIKASLREIAEMDNETDLGAEMRAEALKLEQQLNSMSGASPTEIAEVQSRIDELEQGASQLAGVSPAMQLGMTESMDNNEFKELAKEKLEEVDEMREEYLNTIEDFNYGDEQAFQMGEYVFDIKQRRRLQQDNLDYIDGVVNELEADLFEVQDLILPDDLKDEFGEYSTIASIASERNATEENLKELKQEKDNISTQKAELKEQYGVQTDKELKTAINESISDAESKLETLNNRLTEFGPELVKELQSTIPNKQAIENAYKVRDSAKRKLKTLTRRLNYVQSPKGRETFIENAYNALRSEKAKQEELERKAKQKKAKEQEAKDIEAERAKKKEKEFQDKQKAQAEDATFVEDEAPKGEAPVLATAETSPTEPETETTQEKPTQEAPNLAEATTYEPEVDEEVLEVAGDETSDSLDEGDTQNPTDEPLEIVEIDQKTEERFRKKSTSSNKIQYGPTHRYMTVEIKGEKVKVTDSPKKITPEYPLVETKRDEKIIGTPIVIEVDTEYDATEVDFDDIYNNPIKVTTEDGKKMGYLPTLDWVSEQDKSGNYVNIADFDLAPESDSFVSNAKHEIERIKKIREAVANSDGPINSVVTETSLGAPIYNRNEAGNKKRDKASELLPDPDLEFGIVKAGVVHFPSGPVEVKAKDGSVFTNLAGVPSALWIDNISTESARTIITAIEAVVNNDEELINQFADVAGEVTGSFDFKAKDGLYNLASRSVFLKSFRIEDLKNYDPNRILFNIDDRSGYVYVALAGDGIVYTTNPKLVNRKGYEPLVLNGKVQETPADYIQNLSNNLNRDRLNSEDNYEEIIYDDKVNTIVHRNYNEYAKTKLSTYRDGRNPINHGTEENKDLEYLYYQSPVVQFDTSFLKPEKSTKKPEKIETTEEVDTTKPSERPTGPTLFDLEEENSEISDSTTSPDDIDNEYGFPTNLEGRTEEEKRLAEKLTKSRIADFSNQQVQEITDVIVFAVGTQIRNNPDASVQDINDTVYELFDNTQKQLAYDENFELASRFSKILDNWDALYERAQNHLETVIGYERELDDRFTGEEADFEKRKFDSKARWKENSKDTASSDLKMFLSSIPLQKWVEKDGKKVKVAERSSYLNMQKYVPLDEIYDKITQLLVEKEPNIENFKEILAEQGSSYVPFSSVLNRLEKLPDTSKIESEFVKVMSKQYIDLMISLFEPAYDGETGDYIGLQFKPIHSDRNSATQMIYASWINAQKQSNLVKEINGELVIDPEVAGEIKEKYIAEMSGKKAMQNRPAVRELLESLGVKLSEATWENALQHNAKAFSKGGVFNAEFGLVDGKPRPNTFLGILFDTLPDKGDEPTSFEVNNPIASGNMRSRFRRLAFFELNNSDKVYTDSFTDINGNNIYPYQMNSHYSTTLRNLKNDEELRNTLKGISFSKFSEWIDQIDEIELEYVDGLRDQITKVGLSGENLGKMDTDILSAILYFGTVNQTRGEKGRYQTLTKSDKTTYPIIFAPRHEVGLRFGDDGEIEALLGDTKKRIKKIIKAEFARIYNFRENVQPYLEETDTEIQGYWYKNSSGEWEGGAPVFSLLPELNPEMAESYIGRAITQQEYNKVWGGEITSLRSSDERYQNSIDIMYKIIEYRLLEDSNKLQQRWEDSGLITETEQYIDANYLRYQASKYARPKALKFAMTDFTVNHFISMSEEMMLISGDPALFWKQKGDLASSIKATHENMSKRLAKDIAPRSDGNYRQDERTFTMVTINDSVVASRERKALGKAYDNMEITDAQEYTTVREHLRVARAEGNISPQQYDELIAVVDSADENGYYEFSPAQLEYIMNPMKPVYTGNRAVGAYDANVPTYVKSSSFPLLPQMLKNYELDKLRLYMEDSGINRAAYQTAVKLGAVNPVDIFKGRSIVDNNPFTTANKVLLSRDGFGIQQEVPVKEKKEVNVLSQANKLLFLGIRDIAGFEFESKQFTGAELERVKEDIRASLIRSSERELRDRLGITIDDSGNFQFESLDKVRDILMEEAKDRGWSINAIESIELNEEGTGFEIPLTLSPNSNSIESLILSMVSQITLGIKMNGYSYVQGSSAGLVTMDKIDTDAIVPTRKFDSEYGLKFIEKRNGKTQPAQILIPWNFRDKQGNLLNIKDFTDKAGYIDNDKLPYEARRMMGARIPTQGHNSMIPLEVVGFLPSTMGTLAVVPEEIVAQMGSDFDVDKLYTYQYDLIYNEKEKTLKKSQRTLDSYEGQADAREVSGIQTKDFTLERVDEQPDEDAFVITLSFQNNKYRLILERGGSVMDIWLDRGDGTEAEIPNSRFNGYKAQLADMFKAIEAGKETSVITEEDPYAGVPNNILKQKYMEIFESVYSHEALFDKLKSPLDKPDLGNERDLIRGKLEEGQDITSPASYLNQIDYRLNQRSGQQLVGIFALANTLNSLLEKVDQPIKLKQIVKNDPQPLSIEVEVNGKRITLDRISGVGTTEYNGELRTKADNISLALSAAVDNANENILGNINWNRTTAGVVSTLLMAQSESGEALNLSWVARFTSQPIVRDIVERVEQLESTTSNVAPTQRVSTAIREVVQEYAQLTQREGDEVVTEDYSEELNVISEDMLEKMLGKSKDSLTNSEIFNQINVATKFEQFYKVADDVRDVQQIILSPATGGIDNTVIDAIESIADYRDLLKGFDTLYNTEFLTLRQGGGMTEQGIASDAIYNNAEDMIRALLPEYQIIYSELLKKGKEIGLNINTIKNRKELWRGAKEYIMSDMLKNNDLNLYSERDRLIFIDDIGKRVLDAQDTWGKDNYFLKRLQVELTEKPGVEPSRIRFSADKAVRLDDLKNSDAIRELIISNDPVQRELGRDLVLYDLITGGVQGPRNFSKYIPPAYLSFLGLSDVDMKQKADNAENILDQIVRNNPKLAPIYEADTQGVKYMEDKDMVFIHKELMGEDHDTGSVPYISMWLKDERKWGLFTFAGSAPEGEVFEQTPTLGWENLSEYYPDTLEINSVFNQETDRKPATPVTQQKGKVKTHLDLDSRGMELLDPFITDDVKEKGSGLFDEVLGADYGEEYNTLINFLKRYIDKDVRIKIDNLDNNIAVFRPSENAVVIDPVKLAENVDAGVTTVEELIAHEAVHVATVKALANKDIHQVKQLEALRKKVQRELADEITPDYKMDTLEEFVAFAMTNNEFQNRLNKIDFNNQTAFERFKDIIKSLVEAIAGLMGVTVQKDSALESTIVNVVELLKDNITGAPVLGEGSPFEFGMASFYNQKPNKSVEKVASVLKSRITTVKKNISGADKGTNKYQQLVNTLRRLEEDLKTLQEGNSATAVLSVAKSQAEWASAMLADNSISDSLFFTVKNVIESWDYENVTKEFLTYQLQSKENPMRSAFKEASQLMTDRKDIMEAKLIKRIKDYINKDLPPEAQIVTKDLQFMEDIGFSQEWLLDLSTVDNQLAQYIFDLLSTASRSASDEILEFDTRLSELAEKIDDFDVFRQRDEKGNFTGNFIDEYSEKFYIRKEGIISDLYKEMREGDVSRALKNYHESINEIEEVLDLRMFLYDNFAHPQWNSREEYKQYLVDEYGEEQAETMISNAKAQYAEYKQQRRHFENTLEVEYETADTELDFEAWKEEQLKEWSDAHNPIRALDEKFGVKGKKISVYKATQANDYLTSVPRKTIKGESTGFYDENFDNLTKDQREFYNFYIKSVETYMNYLPNYKVRGLSRNFLPRISMDFVEVMGKEGVKGALRYMNTRMKNSISTGVSPELVETELSSYTEIDPTTGLPKKELLNDFANQMLSKEALTSDEISFNIPVVLRQFAGMAINFKFKSAVEDKANLAMHVMRQAKSVQKKGGKSIRDRVGSIVADKGGVVGLTGSAQYFVDAMLYGEKRAEYSASNITIFDGWNPFENNKKRNRMKEIEEARDSLEDELRSRLISQEEYDEKIEKLSEEYKELGGKNLVWGKIGDRFLEYTQMKGMGYNLTAGIANVGFGFLSNLTWAAGGQDFSTQDLVKAFGVVMKSVNPTNRDYKLANLIKKFDVLFEVTEVEYGTEADKKANTSSKTYNFIANYLHPFEIQRRTEYMVQGISLLAQMYNTEIEVVEKATGETKTINLYEAFDSDANWNDKYEELEEWTSPREGDQHNKLTKFKNKVIQINKYLHGNYDPNSPTKAKKELIGRMLFQFRSWIPMGFAQRFKGEYYDRQLGRVFKGRYRTIADLGIVDSLRGLLGVAINSSSLMSSKKGAGKAFSDLDIANLKMNLREIQILIGFIAIGVALRASLDDDDEESWGSFTGHILMNQLYRVEQDIYFYLSPGTFEEILKNPMPVMKTYQDFQSAFTASMEYITDSEYEGSRLAKKWGKALPLTNQFVKMDFLGSRDIKDL